VSNRRGRWRSSSFSLSPVSGLRKRWAVTLDRHPVGTLRIPHPAYSFASAVGCYYSCRFSLRLDMRFGGEGIFAVIRCHPSFLGIRAPHLCTYSSLTPLRKNNVGSLLFVLVQGSSCEVDLCRRTVRFGLRKGAIKRKLATCSDRGEFLGDGE
jgi:hypothetical protein